MRTSTIIKGLALIAANMLLLGGPPLPGSSPLFAADAMQVQVPAATKAVKGKITNISQKAKTVALATGDGGFFLLKFTDATIFKDGTAADLKEDEAVSVQYTLVDKENVATSIEKMVVKLPEGIKEIKTEELAERLGRTDTVIIDARPAVKYDEGHIPGAVSIPLARLTAAGEDGAKLLAPYRDRQLIFYCGGST